jgi:8-oxo-dGTP pyrophosphatase MutT (NUDIX family)
MWLEEVARLLAASPVRRLADRDVVRRAAVLVPLYVTHSELWVLLTRRVGSHAQHAGAIAFPGGARKKTDRDEIETALREAEAELRIDSSVVVVLGQLDDVPSADGFAVSPVVGAIPYPLSVEPAKELTGALVTVPFTYLARPEAVEEREVEFAGEVVASPVYHYRSHCISGTTALIVADLLTRMSHRGPSRAGGDADDGGRT